MDETAEEFPLEETEEEECVYPPDAATDVLMTEGIKKLISKKSTPQLSELVESLFDVWGGARQIAMAMYSTYNAAPAGSMTRSRILDRLIAFAQMTKEDSDDQEFDDETVAAVMAKVMEEHGYAGKPKEHLPPGPDIQALPLSSDEAGNSGS